MLRRWMLAVVSAAVGSAGLASAAGAVGAPATTLTVAPTQEYVVLYGGGADVLVARAAVAAAGGSIISEDPAVGMATVRSAAPDFAGRVARSAPVLAGATRDRIIGATTQAAVLPGSDPGSRPAGDVAGIVPAAQAAAVQDAVQDAGRETGSVAATTREPLAARQWNLAAIGIPAERDGAAAAMGRATVSVGVIDTGIDAHHPDLVERVDVARSRNFTVDVPEIDGPCAEEADGSCLDGPDVDDNGHGTHVAGVIAASLNGFGVSGVVPGVTLVNLRAGQDSGFFYLGPSVEALTYAADIGVDVVNLSFYVDPWLFNCAANPADSPAEQAEQRTVISAMQRAVDYARAKGVTVISALGNEHIDLDHRRRDTSSPDLPAGAARERSIDQSCRNVPAELDGVISVTAVGPSLRKAAYANYGLSQADLAAPGGWQLDGFGTPSFKSIGNSVLSTYPAAVAEREIADNSGDLPVSIVRQCEALRCAYFKYLDGTSMAAPHVAGVAALAVSLFGHPDEPGRGDTLDPAVVERVLLGTALDMACPPGATQSYLDEGLPAAFNATCEGTAQRNGFFGEGLVNAAAVLSSGSWWSDPTIVIGPARQPGAPADDTVR